MRGDEILDKFLELLPVHLEQRFADGDSNRDLVSVPADRYRHSTTQNLVGSKLLDLVIKHQQRIDSEFSQYSTGTQQS
jgi:hypothetical protein